MEKVMFKCAVCQKEVTENEAKRKKYCSDECKKKNGINKQRNRGWLVKAKLVGIYGGKCIKCGYNKNYAALEFHHRDPKDKKMGLDVRRCSAFPWKTLINEANKCDLICSNCHAETHHPYCYVNKGDEDLYKKRIPLKVIRLCNCCGVKVNYSSTWCSKCGIEKRKKYVWPTKEELEKVIWSKPTQKIAKDFNVSDNTIGELCKKYGIDKPPKGYWNKVYAGKIQPGKPNK